MESAKAAAQPGFEDVDVEFPVEALVESPPWKRPKLDDPDTTTITTESTDIKESHNAEEKPIFVREYPDFHAGAVKEMAGLSEIPLDDFVICTICNQLGVGHIDLTCPDRDKYVRTWCRLCLGNCLKEADHSNYHTKRLMQCDVCEEVGVHWTNRCPKPFKTNEYDDDCGDDKIIVFSGGKQVFGKVVTSADDCY